VDEAQNCVATNTTTFSNGTVVDCASYSSGDGGGGPSDGQIVGIVVPVVVAAALGLAALAALIAAVVTFILRARQKGAIMAELQNIGFSENEADMIVNNAIYKHGQGHGSNPFFITTDDGGNRILIPNAGGMEELAGL
jgi:cbb3-type cytochrome oxidase subunit 3